MWNSDRSLHDNNYPLFIYVKVEKEVKDLSIPGGMLMKNTKGIAILLFAILLQLCSFGMELLTLVVGIVGLIISIIDDAKK